MKPSAHDIVMAHTAHVRDPAGLLERIAELEPLCADLFVRRAVATGDPFKVYRALWWARATGRLRRHREAVAALLRTRRAFAKPMKEGVLPLSSLGAGTNLVGRAEKEDDGTLIKTRVLELATIPLFPLEAHVVSVREELGEISEAVFHARVPLGTGWWLWRSVCATLAAAAVLLSAWSAVEALRRPKVWVVNGHPVPMIVKIGSTRFLLSPGAVNDVRIPAGTYEAEAEARAYGWEYREVGSLPVNVGEVLVWSLGDAPVAERDVVYVDGVQVADEGTGEIRCAEPVLRLAPGDFAFEPPRDTISSTSGAERVVRRAVWMSPESCGR